MRPLIKPASLLTFLGLLLWSAVQAYGQYRQPYPYPYPYPYPVRSVQGDILSGSADVLSASGNVIVQQEQARVTREQAHQAWLDSEKKRFDLERYERENTPSFTEEQEKTKSLQLRRMLSDANIYEITSAKALNTILPYAYQITLQGIQGPSLPLSPYMLERINVSSGDSNDNAGLLKDGGKLQWPFALRGEEQKKIDKLLPFAVMQAASNNLDPGVFSQIKKEADKLNDIVIKKLGANELDGTSYLESKRFIAALQSSLNVLRQPDASRLLTGAYAARGRDVQELVTNMSQDGLRFAPASPGGEAAYTSLYRSLQAYASAAQSNTGFRVQTGPSSMPMSPGQSSFSPKR
jgi:hypothetical protein